VDQRRLRIAHVACGCNLRGGIERGMYELCRRQAADHDVHIFAEDCELGVPGVTFHPVGRAGRPWALKQLTFFFDSARALRSERRKAPFDIVHGHAPCATRLDVATAHSVHAVGNAEVKFGLGFPRRALRYARTTEPLLLWLMAYNFRPNRCGRAIAISQRVKQELMKTFGFPEERIDLIYRGVDSDQFTPAHRPRVRADLRARLGILPGQAAAMFVGNTFRHKGLGVLLEAMNLIAPQERPHLIVVGATSDRDLSLPAAKKQARELGISPWCHFTGRAERVEEMYAAADFLVFPTWYEPFGQVITEAMSSGLPVICSRIAGAAELITEGREGVLIAHPQDPGEVAAKMRALAVDPALCERLGQAGRQLAVAQNWDREAALHMDCYRQVLAQRQRSEAGAVNRAFPAAIPVLSPARHSRETDRLCIAQITFACHRRGGVERVVYELSRRLGRDHDVHIFAGSCELEAEGVTFHPLPVIPWPWVANHFGFFLGARRALRREQARRGEFDIVHVQGIPAWINADIATAHSVHCVGTDAQNALLPAWKRACRYARTADPLMRGITAYNFRPAHCRRVIAISEGVKRDVAAAFGMPPDHIEVVHNGVDLDTFSPARREKTRSAVRSRIGLAPEATVALFVGNEFQRKGLDVLLKALARLDPSIRPFLLVVGNPRDPVLTLAHCRQLAAELGIAPWTRFVGATAGVEDYFAASDFLVLPTIYEPFGLVILEALAAGLPAVFSRLAGASDIVRDGREALLIDHPTDPGEVAARMQPLAESAELRLRMGAAGRKTALSYSWDIIADRTLACYEEVLSERTAALAGAGGAL
jgi:UDP-glucose:(heptosyl)LPS alpha-1,3-glucosyltransferase